MRDAVFPAQFVTQTFPLASSESPLAPEPAVTSPMTVPSLVRCAMEAVAPSPCAIQRWSLPSATHDLALSKPVSSSASRSPLGAYLRRVVELALVLQMFPWLSLQTPK